MSNFGGSSEFGSAVFGGEPASVLLLEIDAEVTTEARRLMARGLIDGTNILAIEFTVDYLGYEPILYRSAIPVNPDINTIPPNNIYPITYTEIANTGAISCYCELDNFDETNTIGAIYILGAIRNSPDDPDNGEKIVLAVANTPIICKNSNQKIAFRVTIQA